MFDIGWGELVVIGIVALIAIGPKELPTALRTLGQMMGKVRRMANEFQSQFQEAMREAEMADLKQQVDTLTSSFDPIETARKELEGAIEDKPAAPAPASAEVSAGSEPHPADSPSSGDQAAGTGAGSVAPLAPGESEPVRPAEPERLDGDAKPEAAGGHPA